MTSYCEPGNNFEHSQFGQFQFDQFASLTIATKSKLPESQVLEYQQQENQFLEWPKNILEEAVFKDKMFLFLFD